MESKLMVLRMRESEIIKHSSRRSSMDLLDWLRLSQASETAATTAERMSCCCFCGQHKEQKDMNRNHQHMFCMARHMPLVLLLVVLVVLFCWCTFIT